MTTVAAEAARPRWLGERSLIVRVAETIAPARWAASDQTRALPGLIEAVPGGSSVMLRFRDRRSAELAAEAVTAILGTAGPTGGSRVHTFDVVYDGEDLADCARMIGRSTDAVILAHSSQEWECAFLGFAPGFAYLRASAEPLPVSRRSDPRTVVPAGSVAMAGPYSAVYPRASPGGWQLIGRTSRRMWNSADEASPALIGAGDRVRFRPVRNELRAVSSDLHREPATLPPEGTALRIDDPGLLTVVADLGRPGGTRWGVSRSGAMDHATHRAANRLVGNAPGDAGLELVSATGARITAVGELVVAIAGAHGVLEITDVNGLSYNAPALTPVRLPDAAQLTIAAPSTGVRTYLAVRGGIEAPVVLGSRSTDTLGALGRSPLRPGDLIGVRQPSAHSVVGSPESAPAYPAVGEVVDIALSLGPDDDLFDDDQVEAFLHGEWTVSSQSDRVGMRLKGTAIHRRDPQREIESQGLIRGAVQVPPHGQPIVFQADHPVTGGYPVIAVVSEADLDVLAQTPPGARLRFTSPHARRAVHSCSGRSGVDQPGSRPS